MRRAALLSLLLIAACDRPIPNLDSAGTSIVCLGDSITFGVGRGEAPAYPELLSQLLETTVVNAGVSGDTTAEGLARLEEALAHDPWLVIIGLGGNDLLRQLPVEETEDNLSRLVEGVLDAGAVPLLIEVHGPFGGRYEDLFDRLEDSYGVPVLEDALPEILTDRRLKSDAIHPNGAGYRRLAEALAEEVQPLLRRRREIR
jgi:lysophospholipase L1-like esterase